MQMATDSSSAQKARQYLKTYLFGGCSPTASKHLSVDSNESALQSKKRAFSIIKDLLEHTVLQGEGNSLLIIGPRGCGKSWVLNEVIGNLKRNRKCCDNFLQVNLNGLVHTDDRLALLDIARQLDVQEDLGEKITLSFSGALNYLLDGLRSGGQTNQSIVFILDEFDLFAHHKNQTLLYNLFDMAQAAHNPIAVIGLTCRLDAVELLEKRVKSRFSHRQINLFCDYSFEEYLVLFGSLLSLPEGLVAKAYEQAWRQHIMELTQNAKVRAVLRHVYNTSPDVRKLKSLLTLPVCRLGLCHAYLQPSDFVHSLHLVTKESVSATLQGVSILELCLIIAMKHISELGDDEPFNFEMVYCEYKKFTERSHTVKFFSKPVALKAFEHLVHLELVCPADAGGVGSSHHNNGKVLKEFQLMIFMLEGEQIKKAVQTYPNCPTDVSRWGTSARMV